MTAAKSCAHPECDRPIVGRGMCRKHYLQAWRAGTLADSPTEKDKRHECPADHPHDVETCWSQHNCRCTDCCRLRFLERKQRRIRLAAYGRHDQVKPARVSAGPVKEHLLRLRSQGFGLERIADAAQVSRSVVIDAVYGPRGARRKSENRRPQTVRATEASRILALTADEIEAALVPALGTARRLQALGAIGYSQTAIAARMGMERGNLSLLILAKQSRVTISTYRAVCDLFSELWQTPQSGVEADRARALAKRHRWVGPLAWDDFDHDESVPAVDVEVDVDEMAVELAVSGHKVKLRPAERREAIRLLHAQRWSDQSIADQIGCEVRTVFRIRGELGLPAFEYAELRQAVGA